MNGYEELANAIVLQAARDYREALSILSLRSWDRAASADLEELEEFFRSRWFATLTKVDGEYLIARLRAEQERRACV